METLFYVFCTSLPVHVVTLFQYWEYPWRSRRTAIVLACLNLVLKSVVMVWVVRKGIGIGLVESLFSLVGYGIYCFTLRIDRFKLLFSCVLLLDYTVVVRGIGSFLAVRLWAASVQSWQSSLLCALVYLLSMPWMLPFFRRTAQLIRYSNAPAFWRTIWLAPAFTSAVILIYTNAFDAENVGNWRFLFARLSLVASIFVVFFWLLKALEQMRQQAAREEQNRQNERMMEVQRAQYANLQSYMEEIRRARHDLRQHQNIMQSFLDAGDLDQLRAYLHAQNVPRPLEPMPLYCRNYAANMLLNYYASRFVAENIAFEFQVSLPERLPVSEPDFCVVLGNLLENALEACSGGEKPYVRAAARAVGNALTIVVDNTAPVQPHMEPDGTFCSSKHAGSGVGTQSVRYIAKQYDGTADFRWENNMFFASVFLNPQPDAEKQ